MEENQQPREISRTDLTRSNYSSDPSVRSLIESAYGDLTERQILIGALINRARTQRGLAAFGAGELLIQITDSESILRDVPIWALAECFRLAVINHNPAHPFGVNEVVIVWREMSETTRQKLFDEAEINSLPSGPPCEWCAGRGLMRVADDGSPVRWESRANTRTMKVCFCRTGAAIPQSDPEPVVEAEPFDLRRAARSLIEERKIAKPQTVEDVMRDARVKLLRQQADEIARAQTHFPKDEATPDDAVVRLN